MLFWCFQHSKSFYNTSQHSLIQSLTKGTVPSAIGNSYTSINRQLCSHREQFGVQYLAQRHFSMQIKWAGDRATNLLISRQPNLPLELQPLHYLRIYHLLKYKLVNESVVIVQILVTATLSLYPHNPSGHLELFLNISKNVSFVVASFVINSKEQIVSIVISQIKLKHDKN